MLQAGPAASSVSTNLSLPQDMGLAFGLEKSLLGSGFSVNIYIFFHDKQQQPSMCCDATTVAIAVIFQCLLPSYHKNKHG